jgi:hypothetical protein
MRFTLLAPILVVFLHLINTAAAHAPPARFFYEEDLRRLIRIHRPSLYMDGAFDSDGEFVPSSIVDLSKGPVVYSGPHTHDANLPLRADPKTKTESVYEFRSGVLVPGKLDAAGNFVPTAGAKMIAFADYKCVDGAPRIWNLPGRFVHQ